MSYYEFLKYDVSSMPTLIPKQMHEIGGKTKAQISQSSKEAKYALIADVEMFVRHYHQKLADKAFLPIPHESLLEIFHFTYTPDYWLDKYIICNLNGKDIDRFEIKGKYCTYGYLCLRFKKKSNGTGIRIPKRLGNRGYVWGLTKEMKMESEKYFTTVNPLVLADYTEINA